MRLPILLAAVVALCCATALGRPPAAPPPAPARASWDPSKTRVFVVCLARFAGEADGATSFSTADRNDGTFVALLAKRGVPKENIVFLSDQDATRPAVEARLETLLKASAPDETLLFYFGSHGSHDPETGEHRFSTFESSVPMAWALDAIDAHFRGKRALLFADSCYSGGLTARAGKRHGKVKYSALSSTAPQQVAWSQWRFVDSLIMGLSGDPLVDGDGDGSVTFEELSTYTGRRLAFAAEGKPTALLGEPNLVLASVSSARPVPRGGRYVEVEYKGQWYKAEVTETRGEQAYVHYTSYDHTWDEWVGPARLREHQFDRFAPGTRVEAKGASSETWFDARVLERWESLHRVRWDGYSEAYDEWVGPSRIRPAAR